MDFCPQIAMRKALELDSKDLAELESMERMIEQEMKHILLQIRVLYGFGSMASHQRQLFAERGRANKLALQAVQDEIEARHQAAAGAAV